MECDCGRKTCVGKISRPPATLSKSAEPWIKQNLMGTQKDYVYYIGDFLSQNKNLHYMLMDNSDLPAAMNLEPAVADVWGCYDRILMDKVVNDLKLLSQETGWNTGGIMSIFDINFSHSSVGFLKKKYWDDKVEMIEDPKFAEYILAYWRNAHKFNWIDPYFATAKTELLKEEKIKAGKARTFTCSGPYQFIYDSIVLGEVNKSIYGTPICQATWSAFHGGANRKVQQLRHTYKNFYLVKGDCMKYDITGDDDDQDYERDWVTSSHSDKVGAKIKFTYRRLKEKYLIDWRGCVHRTRGFGASGSANTSSGNSRRHYRVLSYHAQRIGATQWEFMRHVVPDIMSDDHLFLVDADWRLADRFVDFNERQLSYALCHVALKREDDLVTQNTVEGHTWLGVKLHDNGICTYDIDKMLESAGYNIGLSDIQYAGKLQSLMYLVVNDQFAFDLIYNHAIRSCPGVPFMSWERARGLFNGWE